VGGRGGLDRGLHAVRAGHVAQQRDAADVRGDAARVVEVDVEHGDLGAQAREFARGGLAEAGAAAGDECCFTFDVHDLPVVRMVWGAWRSLVQAAAGFSISSAMPWPPPTQALEMP
jgi:hypothetical protein